MNTKMVFVFFPFAVTVIYLYATFGSTNWFQVIYMGAAATTLIAKGVGVEAVKVTVGVWNLYSKLLEIVKEKKGGMNNIWKEIKWMFEKKLNEGYCSRSSSSEDLTPCGIFTTYLQSG